MTKAIKFRTFGYVPERKPIKWNKKATWIRQGKKEVIQDYINENSTGMSFYENLERLGSVQTTVEYMSKNQNAIYGDFSQANTLQNLEQRRNALMNVWKQLPYDVRAQFGNSFEIFLTDGASYFQKIKEKIEYAKRQKNNTTPVPTDKGNTGEQAE